LYWKKNINDFFVGYLQFINTFTNNVYLITWFYLLAGEAMNTFLNDNWRHVAQEFKPILEETIGDLFKKFANKLCHKYPIEDFLLI